MAEIAVNLPLANPIDKQFDKITRYHVYFFCVYFVSKVPTVWHTLNIIFLSPPMTFTCESKPAIRGDPGPIIRSGGTCPCDNPIWDYSVFTKTVQTKYGIICERRWLNSFSESMSFLGLLVGALIFGVLSDRFGRLTMYSSCQVIMGVAGCLVTVMPNVYLFIMMRFLEGVGTGGAIVTGYVLCIEYCGPNYRATISSIMHFPSNLGLMLLAGLSYLLRNCDHFQLAASVPILAFVIIRCLLWESPKWLLESNRKEQAIRVMEKFCQFNKKPCPTIREEIEAYHVSRTTVKEKRMKFYHIFKYKRHSINFGCMAYLYFVCGMCYYGVSQFIGKMSKNVHGNTVLNGVFLMIGTFSSIFIVNRLGRRPFLRATMFLAGAFMFVVVLMPVNFNPFWVRIMFACFSSTSYYISFIIIFLYGVELFPTNIRNSVLGILSLTSRFGQILGPQINSFSTVVAGSVFGVLAFIGALVTFFLPETRGLELPSRLDDKPHERSGTVKLNNPVVTTNEVQQKTSPKITSRENTGIS